MAVKTKIQGFAILFSLSMSLILTACDKAFERNSAAGDLDVQLPLPIQREDDSETAKQAYEFQIVKLLNIFELKKVRGQYARFYLTPIIKEGRLTGTFPSADFVKNKKNIYTPSNELSVQMASIYYHMQSMALLDKSLGVGEINYWPRDIGLSVKIPQVTEAGDFSVMENNAIYEGRYDAILFVPNRNDQLPIAVNGGILAHEHFHSLFFKLVTLKVLVENHIILDKPVSIHSSSKFQESFQGLEPVSVDEGNSLSIDGDLNDEDLRIYYNMTLLKGLNEGLADFWGWIYTNDNNFIIHSLPVVSHGRNLKLSEAEQENLILPSREIISGQIKSFSKNAKAFEGSLNAYAYDLGTQFARNMKAFTSLHKDSRKITLGEAKTNVAKAIVDFLPRLAQEFINKGKTALVDPNDLALKMIEGIPNLNLEECTSTIKVLNKTKASEHQLKCENKVGKVKIQ